MDFDAIYEPNPADDVPYTPPAAPRLSDTSIHLLRELAHHALDVRRLSEYERQSLRALQRRGLCVVEDTHWRITDAGLCRVIALAEAVQS